MTLEELNREGKVWRVDKPYTWTSFDAVNKIKHALKHAFRTGKVKIGHAGTLDPLATGLLVICAGKATKKIAQIQDAEKEYEGTFTLGAETPSYDLETEIAQTYDITSVDAEMIHAAAKSFLGEQRQLAPAFSARKIEGKRAYDMARKGMTPDIKPHTVLIREFEITGIDGPRVDFRISCSKGTYIRTIAYDFGKKLNNGAHLSRLVRTRIGDMKLADAVSPAQVVEEVSAFSVQ